MAPMLILAAGALLCAIGRAETLSYCGQETFYASKYSCYSGFICPHTNGERSYKCANACYLLEDYTCDFASGSLNMNPRINGSYQLFGVDLSAPVGGYDVAACGSQFRLGRTVSSCIYCPSSVGVECSMFPNPASVVMVGSNLYVEVPGGQQVYVDTDPDTGKGAVGYTQPHSIAMPPKAYAALGVNADNHFVYTGPGAQHYPTPWLACPANASGTASPQTRLYARLHNITLPSDCVPTQIGAKQWPIGNFAAWEYT